MSTYDDQKLIEHLRTKWANKPCPMCNVGPWTIQDRIFQLLEFHPGANLVLGAGPIIPVIPVTCANCGFTAMVNAVVSKALPPETRPPTEPASSGPLSQLHTGGKTS